jgi:hypothetical protein
MADLIARRNANIVNNRKMLLELGIGPGNEPVFAPRKKPVVAPKKAAPKPKPKPKPVKRPADEIENDGPDGDAPAAKMTRVDDSGTRRSARNAGKPKLDYSKEMSEPQVVTVAQKARRKAKASRGGGGDDDDDYEDIREGNIGNRLGKRLHNP